MPGLALVFLSHASNDPPDESWTAPAGDLLAQIIVFVVGVLGPALLWVACVFCALAVPGAPRAAASCIATLTLTAAAALTILAYPSTYGMLAATALASVVASGGAMRIRRATGDRRAGKPRRIVRFAFVACALALGAAVSLLAASETLGWAYLAAFSSWAALPVLAGHVAPGRRRGGVA